MYIPNKLEIACLTVVGIEPAILSLLAQGLETHSNQYYYLCVCSGLGKAREDRDPHVLIVFLPNLTYGNVIGKLPIQELNKLLW